MDWWSRMYSPFGLANCFNISHGQVSNLIKQAGKRIEVQQESDERYDTVVELEKSISFVS